MRGRVAQVGQSGLQGAKCTALLTRAGADARAVQAAALKQRIRMRQPV